jgi:predicted dehydrogenase
MAGFTPSGSGPVGVGFVGAGNISDTYLENLNSFPDIEVLIVGDLLTDRAAAQAQKHGIPASGSTADVLAHPGVELVINITVPAVHVEISSQAIAAGKHVWSEKPIGIDREGARALIAQADAAGLRLGVAPDTVLGPGIQSAKRAIERGEIGRPLFAQTSMQYQGPVSGTEGTIVLPDPNTFTGRTAITRPFSHRGSDPTHAAIAEQPFTDVPEEGVVVGRGLGALDMARAIRTGRPHRATGELGYHVLDTMVAAQDSAVRGEFVAVESTVDPIEVVPVDFDPFARTL